VRVGFVTVGAAETEEAIVEIKTASNAPGRARFKEPGSVRGRLETYMGLVLERVYRILHLLVTTVRKAKAI
jgi:hypothetical protein